MRKFILELISSWRSKRAKNRILDASIGIAKRRQQADTITLEKSRKWVEIELTGQYKVVQLPPYGSNGSTLVVAQDTKTGNVFAISGVPEEYKEIGKIF